jgi:cysteine desulfurase
VIYLDHAATTPVASEVAEAMLPWLTERFGNPSSVHAAGREARAAIDTARDSVAAALHCDYGEITFTSSGTEADNLAILGTMAAAPLERPRLVVSMIEHPAVLQTARYLERLGRPITLIPTDVDGLVRPKDLADVIGPDVALVSVMHANNEIGTIQDIARLARIAHDAGALYHADAVQTFGALPIHVRGLECDLLTVSAHKIHGPKGVGALYVRGGVRLFPVMHGGAQERERRPGTENVAGIVGFGKAVEIAMRLREAESVRLTVLRDRMIAAILASVPEARLNGSREARLPGNVNVSVPGVDGAALLLNLDRAGIAASSGSACSSGSIEPSPVLRAIGLPDDLASSGVRFTLGRSTTEAEVDTAAAAYAEIVGGLRD